MTTLDNGLPQPTDLPDWLCADPLHEVMQHKAKDIVAAIDTTGSGDPVDLITVLRPELGAAA